MGPGVLPHDTFSEECRLPNTTAKSPPGRRPAPLVASPPLNKQIHDYSSST